jgi:adenylate cyclase
MAESRPGQTLKDLLTREILVSERQRVTLLGVVFTLMTFVLGLSLVVIPEGSPNVPPGVRPLVLPIAFSGILYALAIRRFLGRRLRNHPSDPGWLRYIGATLEISLPSIVIALIATVIPPISSLVGPTSLFYFVFIVLATLRLDFWLCAYTGVLAAVEYTLLAVYFMRMPGADAPLTDLLSPMAFIARAFIYVIAGLVAGFVSLRIRRQIMRSFETMEERNRIINMFGQHVSPAVVEMLLGQPVDLGGEVRNVCVMFLDIRDFTAFSERRSPQEVVAYLNRLFGFMIESVNRNHGIVNKFLGDGFMAVFGAPITNREDCQNAVIAAREIVAEVERLSISGAIPPTRIGIGLHCGSAVTGNVGSDQRKEYTIIGDVVNLASRIEQLNKPVGSRLLVSDAIVDAFGGADDLHAREIGPMEVKGRIEPVTIYSLVD